MKTCLECHTENAGGAVTCPACGGGSWLSTPIAACDLPSGPIAHDGDDGDDPEPPKTKRKGR